MEKEEGRGREGMRERKRMLEEKSPFLFFRISEDESFAYTG